MISLPHLRAPWTARAIVLAASLAIALLVPAPQAAADTKADKARAKTAAALLKWASWCAKNGAPDSGRAALAEARALDSTDASEIEVEIEAAEQTADAPTLARGRKIHAPKIAKAYDALAGMKHDTAEEAQFDGFRIQALRWEPSKGRAKKLVAWIDKLEDAGRAARLYGSAWEAASGDDAEPAAATISASVASKSEGDLLLLGSASHQLVAFVSLPKSWKRGKTYPVVVGVDGAGSGFAGYGRKSIAARGSRAVIGVYPMTLSNTNALKPAKYPHYEQAVLDSHAAVADRFGFDLAGVNAILDLVSRHLGGEEKVFLTGFSGGGLFTYLKLIEEPERVAGAVPCCANFSGAGPGAPGAGEEGGPPVRILTGENDKHREFTHGNKNSPGIEPQTDAAVKVLADLGYTSVERQMVKAGHSPLHAMVWEFVDEVLGRR